MGEVSEQLQQAGGYLADGWATLASSVFDEDWVQPLSVLLLVLLGLRVLGRADPGAPRRDPVRTFVRADKLVVLARAGGRCEHHGLLSGRCEQRERLEADHVHPHSRGGWTSLANGQALCHAHNRAKAARVPSGAALRRLARRRADYFPPGAPTGVVRKAPRSAAPEPRRGHPTVG